MALFQVSVLNTYLKLQEEKNLAIAFKKFSKYFHNPTIQENIRNSKEEQFQATFLNELFVNVLGYTLNPQPDFNLSTEFKNENNARKADGAILKDGVAIGVIELKGTNTKDLEGIRRQAFDYKVNQKSCVYVITSNFEKLRFYINDATEFIEFDLFLLTAKDFALLYLCLQKENILKNLPLKIKESSVVKEEQITKDFYKDYSVFKRELFRDLVRLNAKTLKNIRLSDPDFLGMEESNPDYAKSQAQLLQLEKNVKLELFKKSQKLIDRFLFIFFAEDRGLLPPNSTIRIVKDWNKLKELDAVVPLYNRFKLYFSYLDQGRKSTDSRAEIFAYNGGLFKPDNLLDRLEINDELLAKHTTQLSKYNFESQVDVNILGHIFENSLNEIESISAEIEGADFDKQKSKRKKDGVFYTPKYITKYIVENTVGKLCAEKKSELGFREEEYYKGRKRRQKDTLEGLIKILDDYRAWLLKLTICDPACGSGAFLNQALDFLIKEHRYIDELKSKLLGGGLVFSDIETTILENNIYGVDINEESVEIAKLSLWLRTAQPRRKLNDLNSNIKCGNSLIDDKKVAGDKAFKWEEEFADIFANGGFDVVIGNPPYVQSHTLDEKTKEFIYSNYSTAEYQINTYGIFTEKSFDILRDKGLISIIIPNYWISTKYDSRLRKLVFIQNTCFEILNVFSVFEDATVDTLILSAKKTVIPEFPKKTEANSLDQNLTSIHERLLAIDQKIWAKHKILRFDSNVDIPAISFNPELILKGKFTIGDFLKGYQGMKPYEKGKGLPIQTREMMKEKVYHSFYKIDETYFPLIGAKNVQRYFIRKSDTYIKYGTNLAAPRKIEIFSGPRLLVNRILSKEKIDITYCDEIIINNTDVFNFIAKHPKKENLIALLAILGSKLCSAYFKHSNINMSRKAFPKLNVNNILSFPIPVSYKQITGPEKLLELIGKLEEISSSFSEFLLKKYDLISLPRLIQKWYNLQYGEFIKELNKAIKTTNKVRAKEGHSPIPELTKKDEFEWMELFEENKKKAVELQLEIEKIDKEIDLMVYRLYDLTYEEVLIVDEGFGVSKVEYGNYEVEKNIKEVKM